MAITKLIVFALVFNLVGCHPFQWDDDCSPPDAWAKCSDINIVGDPIPIAKGLPLNITIEANVNHDTGSDYGLKLDVHIKKHESIFGWLDLPCIEEVGSCSYDFCRIIKKPNGVFCSIFSAMGKPCSCPIHVGDYSMINSPISIKSLNLPEPIKKFGDVSRLPV